MDDWEWRSIEWDVTITDTISPITDTPALPPNRAAVSEVGLYQTSINCFNCSGWKILLCITKNANTPGDLFRDSG